MKTRQYGIKSDIDMESVQALYANRALTKLQNSIDQPVVLVADRDPSYVEHWNEYEVSNCLPLLELDNNSNVLELGFGTGRMAKYLIDRAGLYVGIDYVKEMVDLANGRNDIAKGKEHYFLQGSFEELVDNRIELPKDTYNRFFISGGVLMYINDDMAMHCIKGLCQLLDDKCIIYISEPIATEKRLTLNHFFSEEMQSEYSAIYRTDAEYQELFAPLFKAGFEITTSRPFFEEDFKGRKETVQWLYVMRREQDEIN